MNLTHWSELIPQLRRLRHTRSHTLSKTTKISELHCYLLDTHGEQTMPEKMLNNQSGPYSPVARGNVARPLSVRRSSCVGQFRSDVREICGRFVPGGMPLDVAFEGQLAWYKTGGLGFVEISHNAAFVGRDTKDCRKDALEHFVLICPKQGRIAVEHQGCQTLVAPGDMILLDAAKTCEIRSLDASCNQLVLHIARDDLATHAGPVFHQDTHILSHDPTNAALNHLFSKICQSDADAHSPYLPAFINVLGAMLHERKNAIQPASFSNHAIFVRAGALISQNFSNPVYRPSHLADDLGVSQRRMQTAFESFGETPSASILSHRLRAAHASITSWSNAAVPLPISKIAFDCGFSDLSTFHRRFKSFYGHSPRTARMLSLRKMQ